MGEDSADRPDGQGAQEPRAFISEAIAETRDILNEEIIKNPITPDNAESFGVHYTQWAKQDIDDLLAAHPDLKPVAKMSHLLGRFLEDAQNKNYDGVAYFLRSEKKNLTTGLQDPEHARANALGAKLGEIAQTLSPQPGNSPQGTPIAA